MQKYTCHKCESIFTVDNPNWTTAYCPKCGIKNYNPDKIENMGNDAALVIVKLVLAIILIIVVIGTMV